jgi:hypothetical protein
MGCGSLTLADVIFTQKLKHHASNARLNWLTATTLHPGLINSNLWRYVEGEERLAKMKNGQGLWLLALGATLLFAKRPEEGALMQE